MFKLGSKVRHGFSGINDVFNNNNITPNKVYIKSYSSDHLATGFGSFIRSQFNETNFRFNSYLFKKIGCKHESPIEMAMNKGLLF